MKKLVVSFVLFAFVGVGAIAQAPVSPYAEGVKLLNYEKNKSALIFFKDAVSKNPKDGEANFWQGEALLAQDGAGMPSAAVIQKAKEFYQQALQSLGSDPWLLVGMAHVQLLEGGNFNAIKQNLELAITSTIVAKGNAKGKVNPDIINAIGYIFAETPIVVADHRFAVDKIKETISSYEGIGTLPANLYINLGINYLKMGGEYGGDAVTAFQEAINRDSKNAYGHYRIGRVYQTQNNRESFDEYYNKAIAADPTFPPVYYALYNFYADLNTETAKANLDLFLKHADKDPSLDIFNADYLFRAGQYDASLEKSKALEATIGVAALPRLGVLLAYNYERKGDSALAKNYIEQFINTSPSDKISSSDYELAVKIISKFSGNQAALGAILEKAIAADTSRTNKLKYYKLGYEMLEKSNMYSDELKWYAKYSALRGVKDEIYYYKTGSIALNAKDTTVATSIAKDYMAAFPEKPNGYSFYVKAARLVDTANNTGVLFEAVSVQNQFLLKNVANNKQGLINNYYTMIGYYNETKSYENAVAMCDKVLELVPNDPTTLGAKAQFTKNIEILKKMQNGKGGAPAPGAPKAASDTTQIKKG